MQDELGGGTRVQAALVGDRQDALERGRGIRPRGVHHEASLASIRDATVMYLRPASWAMRDRLGDRPVVRTEASLTSIGRLTPASTSMRACSMIEMARLDGVPPNMSVNTITPSPVSQAGARQDLGAPLLHVVVGADTDRQDALLRTDDMFQRGEEFARQVAVRHQYESDHTPLLYSATASLPGCSVSRCDESDRAAGAAQPFRKLLGHRHRAVAAAGAADGDGQIALALGVEPRQQRPDQALQKEPMNTRSLDRSPRSTATANSAGQRFRCQFIMGDFSGTAQSNTRSASRGRPRR